MSNDPGNTGAVRGRRPKGKRSLTRMSESSIRRNSKRRLSSPNRFLNSPFLYSSPQSVSFSDRKPLSSWLPRKSAGGDHDGAKCCVDGCSTKLVSTKPDGNAYELYYPPTNKATRLLWALYVPQVSDVAPSTKHRRVCELHFVDGKPTPRNPLPTQRVVLFSPAATPVSTTPPPLLTAVVAAPLPLTSTSSSAQDACKNAIEIIDVPAVETSQGEVINVSDSEPPQLTPSAARRKTRRPTTRHSAPTDSMFQQKESSKIFPDDSSADTLQDANSSSPEQRMTRMRAGRCRTITLELSPKFVKKTRPRIKILSCAPHLSTLNMAEAVPKKLNSESGDVRITRRLAKQLAENAPNENVAVVAAVAAPTLKKTPDAEVPAVSLNATSPAVRRFFSISNGKVRIGPFHPPEVNEVAKSSAEKQTPCSHCGDELSEIRRDLRSLESKLDSVYTMLRSLMAAPNNFQPIISSTTGSGPISLAANVTDTISPQSRIRDVPEISNNPPTANDLPDASVESSKESRENQAPAVTSSKELDDDDDVVEIDVDSTQKDALPSLTQSFNHTSDSRSEKIVALEPPSSATVIPSSKKSDVPLRSKRRNTVSRSTNAEEFELDDSDYTLTIDQEPIDHEQWALTKSGFAENRSARESESPKTFDNIENRLSTESKTDSTASSFPEVNRAVARAVLLFGGRALSVDHIKYYGPSWLSGISKEEVENVLKYLAKQNILEKCGEFESNSTKTKQGSDGSTNDSVGRKTVLYRKLLPNDATEKLICAYGVTTSAYFASYAQKPPKGAKELNKLCDEVIS